MQVTGKIWKSGKHWVVHCPTLQADTQGHSQADGLAMMKDWVRTMLDDPSYDFEIEMSAPKKFTMTFTDTSPILALIVQRQRSVAGLTLQDVATNLGKKHRSAAAAFESGKHDTGFETATKLFRAMGFDYRIELVPTKRISAVAKAKAFKRKRA
jgi:hypothetical protein